MPTLNLLQEKKYYLLGYVAWAIIGIYLLVNYSELALFDFFNKGFISKTADYLFYLSSGYGRGEFIAIVLVGLLLLKSNRNLRYFLMASIIGIILPLLAFLLKSYYNCPRPAFVLGPEHIHTPDLVPILYNHSFPSGHTTGAFALSTFLALILHSQYKKTAWLFIIPAILTAISRIYLGAHFFKDVYLGSILGFAISFIIFVVINRFIPANEK